LSDAPTPEISISISLEARKILPSIFFTFYAIGGDKNSPSDLGFNSNRDYFDYRCNMRSLL
ncbi:hypothetical protein, partial [cf. Phormidesmis sp. LEGE 11477]|uniref:hypothetical protein n=1 Tax=cf. Phormidesmis sp. LEGE 11477 TaxID=1828680 RepID=UPI001D15DD30